MPKNISGQWIKRSRVLLLTMMLPMMLGCATGPKGSLAAFCAAVEPDLKAHAGDLAKDGGPASKRSGRLVIDKTDHACDL